MVFETDGCPGETRFSTTEPPAEGKNLLMDQMLIRAFATVLKGGLHTDMQGLPGPAMM